MLLNTENILQTLFQTKSLQNVSVEQLRQSIDNNPYNTAAYFFLAKKLHAEKETGYSDALQKAALHFSNNVWFYFNLTTATDFVDADFKKIKHEDAGQTHEQENFVDDTEDPILNDKLSSMLQQQAAVFEKPVETSAEIPVENMPYHRIDYFDSQGIQLEENVNDKLGTQLKRFTDWLKQMKRININTVELAQDEAGENAVQHIAEHSNDAEAVITETMAEVLFKQGKPAQAIEVYEKLSFINPAKSAYFAAKIEEIKIGQ